MPIPHERTPRGRWPSVALLALTLGVATWRILNLATEDLWFDEVFSAVLASQGPGELLRRALADQTNPPGFYLALWAWARLGSFDTAWLRALPALAAIATIPCVAWLAQGLGMTRGAALLAALFAAVSPLMLAMGGEVRAYAPLALATTVLLALGARAALAPDPPSRSSWIALALAHVAVASLHYFGALVSLATLLATAWVAPHRRRPALLASLPGAALLAGWIVAVVTTSGDRGLGTNADWIVGSGADAITSFGSHVVGTFGTAWGAATVLALIVVSLAIALRRAFSTADDGGLSPRARWMLVAALLPLLLVPVVAALTGRSLWVARYLIIALPPLWLLLADAATTPRRRTARVASVAAIVGWASVAGPLAEQARTPRPAWSLVVRSLAGSGPRAVCVNESFVGLPLRFYAIAEGVPLEVQDRAACVGSREATLMLLRPGTEASLAALEDAGAVLGPPRALGTRLPDVDRRAILRWDGR